MKRPLLPLILLLCALVLTSAAAAVLPAKTTVIEAEAFCGDTSLTELTVPEGVLRIERRAFADSELTTIVLPASLTSIADDAFSGCTGLVATVPPGSYADTFCQTHSIATSFEGVAVISQSKSFTLYDGTDMHCLVPVCTFAVEDGAQVTGINREDLRGS